MKKRFIELVQFWGEVDHEVEVDMLTSRTFQDGSHLRGCHCLCLLIEGIEF